MRAVKKCREWAYVRSVHEMLISRHAHNVCGGARRWQRGHAGEAGRTEGFTYVPSGARFASGLCTMIESNAGVGRGASATSAGRKGP